MSHEGYPPTWKRVVLMVSEEGEMHAIGGDNESPPGVETVYPAFERIKARYVRPKPVVQKPDRFYDQGDADKHVLDYLEAIARHWATKLPGVEIVHREHSIAATSGPHPLLHGVDGRTSYVIAPGRLIAIAVVLRDAMNYSLVVTKQFQ